MTREDEVARAWSSIWHKVFPTRVAHPLCLQSAGILRNAYERVFSFTCIPLLARSGMTEAHLCWKGCRNLHENGLIKAHPSQYGGQNLSRSA